MNNMLYNIPSLLSYVPVILSDANSERRNNDIHFHIPQHNMLYNMLCAEHNIWGIYPLRGIPLLCSCFSDVIKAKKFKSIPVILSNANSEHF